MVTIETNACKRIFFLLFILLSFDWFAAFNPDLSQSILFIAVHLPVPVFLVTYFKYCSRGLPRPFFQILLLQGCLLQTRYA